MTTLRALRVLTIGAVEIGVGEPFPAPEDRDWRRMIEVGDAEIGPDTPPAAPITNDDKSLVDMTTDERRAWFEARGGKYDARWSDARVLEAANGLA